MTLLSPRAGLVVEPGAKATFNGVEIGRVGTMSLGRVARHAEDQLLLDVEPHYLGLIPANVNADIRATTVFGNKFTSFSSPQKCLQTTGSKSRCDRVLSAVTTEFNTIFPRMPQIRAGTRLLAVLTDVYADASPDLWKGLDNTVTSARTFNDQRTTSTGR